MAGTAQEVTINQELRVGVAATTVHGALGWTQISAHDHRVGRHSLKMGANDSGQTNKFYFFQADIKLTRDLPVKLGLRYEYSSLPFGLFGAAGPQVAAVGAALHRSRGGVY